MTSFGAAISASLRDHVRRVGVGAIGLLLVWPIIGSVFHLTSLSVAAACSGSSDTIFFKGYDPDTLSTHYMNNSVISIDRDTSQAFNAACSGKTYWYLMGTNDGDFYNTSGKVGDAYRFSSSGDSYAGAQFSALAYDSLAPGTTANTNDGIHTFYTHLDRCTGSVTTNPTGFVGQSDGAGHFSIWGWMFAHSAGACTTIGSGDQHVVRLDRVVPTMAISTLNGGTTGLCAPTCGTPLKVNAATISIGYSATDPDSASGYHSGLHSVDADTNSYVRWFWSTGSGWQLCGTLTNPGTTANQPTLSGSVNCALPVAGTYSFTAVAQDLSGNCSGGGYLSSGICFADNSLTPTLGQVIYDTTAPTPNPPNVSATVTSSVYQASANGTVFFRPAAASSVTLTATASDPETGIAKITFQTLTPTTGWTPAPALPNGDVSSPYTESLGFGATAVSATVQAVARNGAGTDTSARTLTLTADSVVPSTTFTVPGAGTTSQPSDQIAVTWTETDGTGAGVGTRSLQRQKTAQTGPGTCNTGAWANDGTASTAVSPVATSGLLVGTCYRWIQTLTDRVGNAAATTSGTIVRDTTANLGQQRQHTLESWDLGAGDSLGVNAANGNLVVSHPIVTLPIRGSSISLGLTYNSQDSANVGMGPGWRLNVFRRLALNADNTVTFIDADGARYTFTAPVTVGTVTTYTRPIALYATLVKDTSISANEFILTYRDLSKDKFDILGTEGILVRAEDRFANGVTVAYVSGTNRITTITDTAGSRTIDFTWDGSNRLSQIADWAWIDGAGVVQTTNTGARRAYRFFYDASSRLAGWSDPLNTAGSCPTGGSQLTCVTYPTNELDISKTLTVTGAGATALTSSTRTITSKATFSGSNVATVIDAEQVAASGPATTFTWATPARVSVVRPGSPATTTGYALQAQNDAYGRVASVFRTDAEDGVQIERRTVWDGTYATEPATVTENYGALVGTPARTTTYTYVASSLGLLSRLAEPLTASTNRWTDYVYNANNDVTLKTVSQDGSGTLRTITKYCYTTQSMTCPTTETGLTLVRQIDNWVSAGPQNADTNVATDYTYDAYGEQTRLQRHNRDAAGAMRDDRITGFTFDALGNQTSEIANYADGVVTNGTTDTTPGTDSVRTDLTTANGYDTAGNRVSSADPRRAIGLAIPSTQVYAFTPTDDAHVSDANPTTNYGTDPTLEVRLTGGATGAYEPFVDFTVTGLVGTVTGTTLRLQNTATASKSTRDVCVYRVPSTTWTEGSVTWNTKPGSDATSLACVHGDQAAGTIDYNLGTAVTGPGLWAFRMTNSTTFEVIYASNENGVLAAPQLLVTVSYGPLGADDFVTRWTFDGDNERLSEVTPTTYGQVVAQKTQTSIYDELGVVRQATDFGGVVTGTAADRDGRALQTFEDTDGAGSTAPASTSVTTYDTAGRSLTAKDRNQVGNSALGDTTTTYDSLGRVIDASEATGTADQSDTLTQYDGLDRQTLLSVGGQDTIYGLDLGGRTISTDDGFTCTTSTFDYRDLALTTTSGLTGGTCSTGGATWRTVTTSYDGLGRSYRSEQTSSSSGTGDSDRTQDDTLDAAGGRLTSGTRTGGTSATTTYAITLLDQTIAQTPPDGSTTKTTYDAAGNAADRCYWKAGVTVGSCFVVGTPAWTNPPNQSTSTTYDARNSRIQQVDGLTNQVTTYDPTNNYQVAAVYLPTGSGNELQSLYGYDVRHRLTSITHQLCAVADVNAHTCTSTTAAGADTYAYDDNDNRTRVNEANGATSADRYYCYDARDELVYRNTGSACSPTTKDEAYTYDDAGNRTSAFVAGSTRTFTNTTDGQLTACANPACAIAYDTSGRTLSWTDNGVTWSYLYDSANRMTSACHAASCTGSGFDRLDFTYDGEGHRTKIVETTAAGGVTTRDLRYQGDAVVEESVNGTVVRATVVDEAGAPTKVVVTNSGSANGTYLPTWNGHGDLLALWQVQPDGTLLLAASVTYDTWGRPAVTTANGIPDLGWDRLYIGRSDVWWDNTFGAGLLYMHARSYSPTLGRFLQPDPSADEANLYGYASDSPVTKADASGQCWQLAFVGLEGPVLCVVIVGAVAGVAWVSSRIPFLFASHPGSSYSHTPTPTYRSVCLGRGCGWLWAKDKRLTPGEAGALDRLLKRDGYPGGVHDLKEGGSKHDLFKKPNGDIVIKPRGGVGPGEPTGWNIRDLWGNRGNK